MELLNDLDSMMADVTFLPWIGDRYSEKAWNGRLLVLGESHYGVDESDRLITRKFTLDYCNGERHRFWTNIMQVVTGKHHSEQEPIDFWSTISFYNYIQESLDDSRQAPDEYMWELAIKPFQQVLSVLNPDRVLVLGYRLWEHFDFGGKDVGTIKVDGYELSLWSIPNGGRSSILCGCIQHPSSGFSSEGWAPLVEKFLATCC